VKSGPRPLRGYVYISTAAFLWGVSATLGRAAFTGHLLFGKISLGTSLKDINPLILSQSRATLSLAVLLPILLVRRGSSALRVPAHDLLRFFLLGILGVAASNYLYYLAIQRTNVATAIILQYTAPVWVLLYTAVRGSQPPSPRKIAAVVLSVAGCALAVGLVGAGAFRMDAVGVTAALLAAFSFAFYNVQLRPVGVPAGLLAAFRARSILLLLRRPATPRTDPRHCSQLPRASIQHCDHGNRPGRVSKTNANLRDRLSPDSDNPDPVTRPQCYERAVSG
jgi:drug/metabolite transporter (DMT)-like permease